MKTIYLNMLEEAKSKADNASLKNGYCAREVNGDQYYVNINPVRTNGKYYNRTEWYVNGKRVAKDGVKKTLSVEDATV